MNHITSYTSCWRPYFQNWMVLIIIFQTLAEYWLNKYDWRSQEKMLNQFPQFKTTLDGLDIHFIHLKPGKTRLQKSLFKYIGLFVGSIISWILASIQTTFLTKYWIPDPVKSKGKTVLPLMLVHGWPGSVVEFVKILPMLTSPRWD